MPPAEPARSLIHPRRVRDLALWNTAQQLMAVHQSSNADVHRCVNVRCVGAAYPCTPARTAMRLATASQLPFHQRLTALIDASTCAVAPSARLGLEIGGVDAGYSLVAAMIGPSDQVVDATADRLLVSAVVA